MSAFFNSVFTSVSFAASALLTPEFWAVQWPLWKMSILTCASILVFRICYRSFILKLTTHLKERYHYDYIDSFAKAFNHPIQAFLWILAFYSFIVLSPLSGHGLIMQLLKRSNQHIDETIGELISALAHMLCIMLGVVMVAKEWDYDITAFIASLGIGAMAIAFAAKDSLANVFGSIVIITERSRSAAPASVRFIRNWCMCPTTS